MRGRLRLGATALGETFDFDRKVQHLDLRHLPFSEDVALDGPVTNHNGRLTAQLAVTAAGQVAGTLELIGTWATFSTPAGAIRLSGEIGGRRVALLTLAA